MWRSNSTVFGTVLRWDVFADAFNSSNTNQIILTRQEEGKSAMTSEIPVAQTYPVVPKVGALIRVTKTGTLLSFDRWEGGALVLSDGISYAPDEVEALTPAHYGTAHKRCVGVPGSGYEGIVVELRNWRSLSPVIIREKNQRAESWGSNTLAALAPVLDPATEKPEERAARLERELNTLRKGLHDRMVAEGVARSWCAEFDMILDATGLPPRERKNVIEGTMRFRTVYSGDPKDILDEIKRRPWDYIPTRDVTVEEVTVPETEVGPRLS